MWQQVDRMRYHADPDYRRSIHEQHAEERLQCIMEQFGISRLAALQREIDRDYATSSSGEPGWAVVSDASEQVKHGRGSSPLYSVDEAGQFPALLNLGFDIV
jgi:hypothetical protein